MENKKFATVINCIDGRVQEPVRQWIIENYLVDYVDDVTEPGADKTVSQNDAEALEDIKSSVEISVNAHGSSHLFIAGHFDCAGNPISNNDHFDEIRKSVEILKSWNLPVEVVGLWVNEDWEVETVS